MCFQILSHLLLTSVGLQGSLLASVLKYHSTNHWGPVVTSPCGAKGQRPLVLLFWSSITTVNWSSASLWRRCDENRNLALQWPPNRHWKVMGCASLHYLPVWPVILGKDGVVCVHCPICHQHNGLAAVAAPPSLIELETDRERMQVKIKQSVSVFVCVINCLCNEDMSN